MTPAVKPAVVSIRGRGPGGWLRVVTANQWLHADLVWRDFLDGYSIDWLKESRGLSAGTIEDVIRWYMRRPEIQRKVGA